MFDYFEMIGTYEERKIKRDIVNGYVIDTVRVTDAYPPYETAVAHKDFNNGAWIILERSATIPEAEATHDKWVKTLQADVNELTDMVTGKTYRKKTRRRDV